MRHTDPVGRPGTTPPVPGRPSLLLGLLALLFALITWQVAVDGPLARADARLSGRLVRPDRFPELLADLGNVTVAVPVLALALAYAALRARRSGVPRWWVPPLAGAVLMALVPALIVPLKELVARPGPPVTGPGTGFYPSGHTATATVAYGTAVLLLLPWLRSARARAGLVCLGLVVNLGVGFGLARRGYHWPLDVVAAWCLCGMLLLGLTVFLSRTGTTGNGDGDGGGPAPTGHPRRRHRAADPAGPPLPPALSRSSCRSSSRTPSRRSGPS
ncbi:phosphatase PAP2 family protein [Streptomyces sp. NPDC008313]|uniref:phosphatase PAP2 family protein n=1 Tax=Streptomyces sp. NPDC008313 TaxID=3364826 RepID=UPI0036EEA59F